MPYYSVLYSTSQRAVAASGPAGFPRVACVRCCSNLLSSVRYCTILFSTIVFSVVQYCSVRYSIALFHTTECNCSCRRPPWVPAVSVPGFLQPPTQAPPHPPPTLPYPPACPPSTHPSLPLPSCLIPTSHPPPGGGKYEPRRRGRDGWVCGGKAQAKMGRG